MPSKRAQFLLVEGDNDKHVVWNLCEKHEVSQTFKVESPKDVGENADGLHKLMELIPIYSKMPDLEGFGVIIDADIDLNKRWEMLFRILKKANYDDLPEHPDRNGLVRKYPDQPNLGIWLMPDNNENGMLEDFITYLIPTNDELAPLTKNYIQAVETNNLNKYKSIHTSKAFIHAWLACQEIPGVPMGTAIQIKALLHDAEISNRFIAWLNKLFN